MFKKGHKINVGKTKLLFPERFKNIVFKKGYTPWNKGKKCPSISESLKGRVFPKKHRTRHSNGYWLIWVGNHPHQDHTGRVPEHRLVMEKKIGKYINPKELDVHHI